MSMMPAFSPGPCTTSLLHVGRRFKCTRDDLYEQCSLHITLKIPSSVSDGSRPKEALIRSYSSGVMPCSLITSGVMAEACVVVDINLFLFSHLFFCNPSRSEGALPSPCSFADSQALPIPTPALN